MAHEQPSTLARYLFVAYVLLVVYASLHPFSGWRDRGLPPFAFVAAPFTRPMPVFDVVVNVIGYVPLGFLAALAAYPRLRGGRAFVFGFACSLLLSFALESLQLYLPSRTSSNLDLLTNAAGGALGALAAVAGTRALRLEEGLLRLRERFMLPGRRIDLPRLGRRFSATRANGARRPPPPRGAGDGHPPPRQSLPHRHAFSVAAGALPQSQRRDARGFRRVAVRGDVLPGSARHRARAHPHLTGSQPARPL